ncbi:mite group 2 allergen Lep d 2-like [Penaeus japonicus]|uniref:mite group 2 allergen Lep d 2-like n=1 Tax=Penaeus japonicus TaxID=27405 RepID=UPI001C716394|nr:mite group 2 allergen Lep d 2-like [Penaeus japonicus]XP_042884830.1 mite group 2 allergen Lep d 2-like [Penaeus japonicus]
MRAFLIALSVVSAASATFFQDCGSKASDIVFNLEGCDEIPCLLKRGETYAVNFQFTASEASSSLTIGATASIAGINVPWPGLDTDGCAWLEGSDTPCPYAGGARVDWTMQAEVLSAYPTISSVATFKLIDDQGVFQTCAAVPFTIV